MPNKEFWLCLQGHPCSQKRAKATGRSGFIRLYDPSSEAKAEVRADMQRQLKFLSAPDPEDLFHVEITAYFTNPESPKAANCERSWMGYRSAKPDVDNIAKFYLDAANGLIWHDDAQVVKVTVKKLYSFQPYTAIKVIQMRPLPDDKADIIKLFSKHHCKDLYHFLSDFHEALDQHDQEPCQDTIDNVLGLLIAYTQGLGKKIQKLAGELK